MDISRWLALAALACSVPASAAVIAPEAEAARLHVAYAPMIGAIPGALKLEVMPLGEHAPGYGAYVHFNDVVSAQAAVRAGALKREVRAEDGAPVHFLWALPASHVADYHARNEAELVRKASAVPGVAHAEIEETEKSDGSTERRLVLSFYDLTALEEGRASGLIVKRITALRELGAAARHYEVDTIVDGGPDGFRH